MEVSERTIAKATGLSTDGEHWSKNMNITKDQCNRLLKSQYHNANWEVGVPRNFIKDEWKKFLIIL